MSEILNEVLSANEAYAEEFGDKKKSLIAAGARVCDPDVHGCAA